MRISLSPWQMHVESSSVNFDRTLQIFNEIIKSSNHQIMFHPASSASSFENASAASNQAGSPSSQGGAASGATRHIQIRHCNALTHSLHQERTCPSDLPGDLPPHVQMRYAQFSTASIEQQDALGRNALHHAVRKGDIEMVRLLHERGGDASFSKCIHAEDVEGMTPLMWAIQNSDSELTRLLLAHVNDVKLVNSEGVPLLGCAALGGSEQIMFALQVKLGETQFVKRINDLGYNGALPLMLAAKEGHEAVVMFLLSKNAKVELSDAKKQTALHYAAVGGNVSVVREILCRAESVAVGLYGAEVGSLKLNQYVNDAQVDGMTPLMLAAENGEAAIVRLLLDWGADATLRCKENVDALGYAASSQNEEVERMLLTHLQRTRPRARSW